MVINIWEMYLKKIFIYRFHSFLNGMKKYLWFPKLTKKEIRLYKCDEFPMKWNLHKVLMKNVNAADTLIIRKDNIWFMLTNICSAGYGDHQSELHIYYSKDLFSNNWSQLNLETL